MATVEELVVKATPKGMGEVNDELEGMEQKTQEATEEVEETGRSLGDMSAKFKGAMGAIIGGLTVAAGGILSRVPSIQAAVQQLGTTLDLLGQKIEEEFSGSLGTLNEDLAETNRKVDEADGPIDALATAWDGYAQSVQNASVDALQNQIEDLIGIKVPENWLDLGWDTITLDTDGAIKNMESVIMDFLTLDYPEGTFMDNLVDDTEGMRRQIKRVFRETSNSIINRWTRFTNNLQQEVNTFTDNFVEEMKLLWPRTKTKFNSLETKVSQVFSNIASNAKQSGRNLVGAFQQKIQDLTGVKVPKNWLDFGWDVITLDFDNAVENLKSIVNDFINLNFPEGTFMDTIVDEAQSMKRRAQRKFRQLKSNVESKFDTFISNLQTDVYNFTDTFVDEVGLVWIRSKSKFNTLETKIGDKLDDIVDDAKSAGKDLIDEFKSGIEEKKSELVEKVESVMEDVRDRLPGSPAETGPLSDLDETGTGLVDTFSAGVSDSVGRIDGGLVDGDRNTGGSAGAAIARNNGRTVIEIEGRQVERATRDFRSDGTDLRGRYG